MTPDRRPNPSWARRVRTFFLHDLWRLEFSELNRFRRFVYHSLQVLVLTAEGFFKDRLPLRASALTYSMLLAIVPLLAIMFALLKGLGVQEHLEGVIIGNLAPGSQDVAQRIVEMIGRVNAGSLGALGLVILLVTVVNMLSTIESAFNHIWGVRVQRSLIRKTTDYLSLVVIMPVVLFAALSLTATLKSTAVMDWLRHQPSLGPVMVLLLRLTPYFALWMFFSFLFAVMPNTRVRPGPAFAAGILTGTLWQLSQWAYLTFQVGVAKYNAIYGTLAQLPLILIWLYIAWVIVLFGAEFSFALQNGLSYREEQESAQVNFASRSEWALVFVREIHRRFKRGDPLWSEEELGAVFHLPIRLVRDVLNSLVQAGFLVAIDDRESRRYSPARDLEGIPVSDLFERLEHLGKDFPASGALTALERRIMERANEARRRSLKGVTAGLEKNL